MVPSQNILFGKKSSEYVQLESDCSNNLSNEEVNKQFDQHRVYIHRHTNPLDKFNSSKKVYSTTLAPFFSNPRLVVQ